jgi:hypothetical protein
MSSYESALLFIRDGLREDATRELSGILEHPMMAEAPTHLLQEGDDEGGREFNRGNTAVGADDREAAAGGTSRGGGGFVGADGGRRKDKEKKQPLAPAVRVSLTPTMTQVKFLSLKNLGRLVEDMASERELAAAALENKDDAGERMLTDDGDKEDAASAASRRLSEETQRRRLLMADYALALRCYAAAVEIDGTDASLWRRLGLLAARRGLLYLARHALERGLGIHPRHPLILEDLAEVLLAVGDFPACRHVAGLVATLDPYHARARDMKRGAEELTPARGYVGAAATTSPRQHRQLAAKRFRTTPPDDGGSGAVVARVGDEEKEAEEEGEDGGRETDEESAHELTLELRGRTWEAVALALAAALEPPTPTRLSSSEGEDEEEEEEMEGAYGSEGDTCEEAGWGRALTTAEAVMAEEVGRQAFQKAAGKSRKRHKRAAAAAEILATVAKDKANAQPTIPPATIVTAVAATVAMGGPTSNDDMDTTYATGVDTTAAAATVAASAGAGTAAAVALSCPVNAPARDVAACAGQPRPPEGQPVLTSTSQVCGAGSDPAAPVPAPAPRTPEVAAATPEVAAVVKDVFQLLGRRVRFIVPAAARAGLKCPIAVDAGDADGALGASCGGTGDSASGRGGGIAGLETAARPKAVGDDTSAAHELAATRGTGAGVGVSAGTADHIDIDRVAGGGDVGGDGDVGDDGGGDGDGSGGGHSSAAAAASGAEVGASADEPGEGTDNEPTDGGPKKKLKIAPPAPVRRSRRQEEADEQEVRRQRHDEHRAEADAAATRAQEKTKWTPMKRLREGLVELAVGGGAAAAGVLAADKDNNRRGTTAPSKPLTLVEEAQVTEEDEVEADEVAAFISAVSSRNSGTADVAWRLLLHITERWCPTSEAGQHHTLCYVPLTLRPIPSTLYSIPYTLYPMPSTFYLLPSTLYPIPHILYPHPIPHTLYPTP